METPASCEALGRATALPGEQETEPNQTGLRRAERTPNPTATGRLQLLRLFSTLLAIRLNDRVLRLWPSMRMSVHVK